MRRFKFFGLAFSRKPATPVTAPESYEAPDPVEPRYRCAAPQAVPGNVSPPDATATLLEKLDGVAAHLEEITGELGDLAPETRESIHDELRAKAFKLLVNVVAIPTSDEEKPDSAGPSDEVSQDGPEGDGPKASGKQHTRATELYQSIYTDLNGEGWFQDAHWNKLCTLANMLKRKGVDAKAVGALLADVAEVYVQNSENFNVFPELKELASLAGHREFDKGFLDDEDENETDMEACHA